MIAYLSSEWIEEANRLLAAAPDLAIEAGGAPLVIQQTDQAPEADHLYHLVFDTDGARAVAGRADRADVEINEEGGEGATKRFVIKVHGQRIAGIAVALDKGRAIAAVGPIERSEFTVAQGDPLHTRYENVDEVWMAKTLGTLMERIER